MAATLEFDYYGASSTEPTGANAESGFKFAREDTQSGSATNIPIPTATGQNFSWYKLFALKVTAIGGTLTNFTAKLNTAPTTGFRLWFKSLASYTQPTGANKPVDDGTANGAAPSGYTALSTSIQQWYAGPISGGTTGRKGDFLALVLGVGFDYAGSGGINAGLPNITISYDES